MRTFFVACLLGIGSIVSSSAFAWDYQVCNHAATEIHVAYAFTALSHPDPVFGSQSGIEIESKGWWPVQKGQCKTFTLAAQNVANQFVSFTAVDGLGNVFAGNDQFCLNPTNAFQYTGNAMNQAQACTNAGGQMRGFYRTNGTQAFNFSDNQNYIKYCNNSGSPVRWASAVFQDNSWISNGWMNLDTGACFVRKLGGFLGDMYTAGTQQDINGPLMIYPGPTQFCVDTSQNFTFDFADSRNCVGGGLRKIGFYRIGMQPGLNTFTFSPM